MKHNLLNTKQKSTEFLQSLGLYQITLNLPSRLDHVTCFMAQGETCCEIIDTGLDNKETVEKWEQRIAQQHITDIIITHYHPDHVGYAGGLQGITKANVSMTEVDRDGAVEVWQKEFLSNLKENY